MMLNQTQLFDVLFIAQTRIEAINYAFVEQRKEESSAPLLMVVLSLVAAILLALAAGWIYQRRSMRVEDTAKQLFRELCRELELSGRQVRLLKELAKTRNLENPNEIFVRSELWRFDPTFDRKLCRLNTRKQLQVIQRILFQDAQPLVAS